MKTLEILVVEDDPNLGVLLNEYLNAKGHHATLAQDGEEGFKQFTSGKFDFLILDVMMPKKDGFTLAQEVRNIDKKIPILFLTAKSMREDTIKGFKLGADDYMTKPFSMEELLVRIEAITRRTMPDFTQSKNVFEIGKYKFDYNQQALFFAEEKQKLTTKENELLRLLCQNLNGVLERNDALKVVWGDDNYFNGRSMDVYIAKLRKHLKKDDHLEIINIHGRGFKLALH